MWFVDNFGAEMAVKKGSGKLDLQLLAVKIFDITKRSDIELLVSWIPREYNTNADSLSKYVDVDDWEITGDFFTELNQLWNGSPSRSIGLLTAVIIK